jgi:RND family efflux transporter MFP subunit
MQSRESKIASMPLVRLTCCAAILATAALALSGCRSDSSAQQQQAPGGMPPTPVALAVAAASPVEDATEYVATLKSLRSTIVQPQIDGQITQIDVVSGQRVARGAPLMQIDARRQQAAVSSQQAEVAAREAAVGFARQQAQRSSELFAAGAISKQEQEQAATALQTAEANLKALQAQVQQQQVQLRYFTVAAPTAGIVGDVPVRVGNVVTPQTMLTTIDQNETLEVHIDVPVERGAQLKPGLPIRILSSDGSQELADTKVTFVSPHVDDQTQSVLVKGTVPNPTGALRASQYVRARIIWKTSDALVVPVTAVLRINGQFFAFVAEDAGGKLIAKQRAIAVGPIAGQNYPILSGIKPGERVVTSGAQKLADGVAIQPANHNPEPRTQNENPEPRTPNPERP